MTYLKFFATITIILNEDQRDEGQITIIWLANIFLLIVINMNKKDY